ncbi:hypothetical protein ABQF86_20875, partial [Xanthomonas campestris]|nr:hypothetical protein [Xanthomonas campestris pv. campestris]
RGSERRQPGRCSWAHPPTPLIRPSLTDPLNVLAHDPPMFVETGVFAYEGMVVCDGLLLTPILIGRSYQDTFNADYTRLRKAGHLYKTATQFNHLFMLDSPDNA